MSDQAIARLSRKLWCEACGTYRFDVQNMTVHRAAHVLLPDDCGETRETREAWWERFADGGAGWLDKPVSDALEAARRNVSPIIDVELDAESRTSEIMSFRLGV